MIREDAVLVITGRVDHRGDDVKMIAQQIQEPRFDADSVVRLRVPATRMSRSTVEQLRSVLANHPGNAGVFLHMVSDGDERVIQLGNDHRVEPRTALFAELRELLGPSVVL
jgi:DNA polymerase-3 subunit alpha